MSRVGVVGIASIDGIAMDDMVVLIAVGRGEGTGLLLLLLRDGGEKHGLNLERMFFLLLLC